MGMSSHVDIYETEIGKGEEIEKTLEHSVNAMRRQHD